MINKLVIVCIALVLLNCSGGQQSKEKVFDSNWESIKQYEIPTWFSDAKFGIFIHWGPYSVPAYASEWYPRFMYQDSVQWNHTTGEVNIAEPHPVYLHHKKTYGDPSEFGYKDFIPMFKAEKFDADEWTDLFKKAGAKYVIPVAEHHDGFAMYNSNVTRWNAVKMGPMRDVIKELKQATKAKGLYFGVSSHFAFNWNYYNQKPGFDTGDPEYSDLYSPAHEAYTPCSEEFLELWWKRTTDIIDNYQPDILWFDFYIDREEFIPYHPQIASYYYNKGIEWDKDVVLQTKNMGLESFPEGSNVLDIERGKLADIRKDPWQTDTSVGENSWCYVSNWKSKTAKSLIDDLIDIVSKNGTMLLNIGPKADGTIPNDQKQVLLDMGEWLDVNGEAIYNTVPWRIFGEGPTEVHSGHHTEAKNESFTSDDFRFTTRDNTVFVIALAKSDDKTYTIESLGKASELLEKSVAEVSLLGSGNGVSWEQLEGGLKITVKSDLETEFARVFKVVTK